MATVRTLKKAAVVNPLKMSQPLGGALAFMGVAGAMPLFHGSQGCTSFALVLLVRHFKEAIPLQTTAMSEVATILGGYENVEAAVSNIAARAQPALIGICSTGVTETKGDDLEGFVRLIRQNRPDLDPIALVPVNTPDFSGSHTDGWVATCLALVKHLVEAPEGPRDPARINVWAGPHLTPGDIDELRDVIESFGLDPLFVPDLSGSLDGHVPEDFTPTTLGGARVDDVRAMGRAAHSIAIGASMRPVAAAIDAKTGASTACFDSATGLAAMDALIGHLAAISGRPVPNRLRRQRGQLVDAMLDGHFHFGRKRIAVALEPDLLFAVSGLFASLGAQIVAAVTTTASPLNAQVPADEILIGDLEDFETAADAGDADLLVSHAHARQAAERLDLPLLRLGLPIFDRLGAGHRVCVGYRGARDLIFEIANIFMARIHEPTPQDWPLLSGPQKSAPDLPLFAEAGAALQ